MNRVRDLTDTVHAGCDVEIHAPQQPALHMQRGVALQPVHGGWKVEVGGATHDLPSSQLRVLAARLLGIWLGGENAVRAEWERRVVAKMQQRLHSLRAAGLPTSVYGRVIVQKVLYLGISVFFATNQVPRGMHAVLRDWSLNCTQLFWETVAAEERAAAGAPGGRPPSLVRLATACQDHTDGGVRAVNVASFISALRTASSSRSTLRSPAGPATTLT